MAENETAVECRYCGRRYEDLQPFEAEQMSKWCPSDDCPGREVHKALAKKLAMLFAEPVKVTLRNGAVVLGKNDPKYGPVAMTYANRTQAEKAAGRVGGTVSQFMGRPFYVMME